MLISLKKLCPRKLAYNQTLVWAELQRSEKHDCTGTYLAASSTTSSYAHESYHLSNIKWASTITSHRYSLVFWRDSRSTQPPNNSKTCKSCSQRNAEVPCFVPLATQSICRRWTNLTSETKRATVGLQHLSWREAFALECAPQVWICLQSRQLSGHSLASEVAFAKAKWEFNPKKQSCRSSSKVV